MSLIPEQWEFLKDVGELIYFIETKGYIATGGELWRTPEQQEIYLMTGKSKTRNSKHLMRLAIDLNFFKDGKLITCPQVIGDFWEALDKRNVWGGNWKMRDYPHFERSI